MALRDDPLSGFNFRVEIDGITVAGFSECSGLSNETDAIEYRNGNTDITVTKLPGLKKFGNITLKRGIAPNKRELLDWRQSVLDGKTDRKSGAIVLQNEARQDALTWTFSQAWPRKLEGPNLNGKTNEVAIETLEIVVEKLSRE